MQIYSSVEFDQEIILGQQDGWSQLHQPSFSKAALKDSSCLPVDTNYVQATEFSSRPPHLRKFNTEYTSTTELANRIASTVNSYTFLVLVHVQENYIL